MIRKRPVYRTTHPDTAVVIGTSDTPEEQWFQYKDRIYHVDDILEVMKAAESGVLEPPDHVVARVRGDYYVLALAQNNVYVTKGNFGDMSRDAQQVANLLNGAPSDS